MEILVAVLIYVVCSAVISLGAKKAQSAQQKTEKRRLCLNKAGWMEMII